MIKRVLLLLAVLLAMPVMVPVSSYAADAPTIAIIDYNKILSDSKAGASLQKQIEAKREAFSREFAEKDKTLKASQAELIEAREKLTAEEFNKKRQAFDKQISDVKSLFEKRRNGLQQGVDKAMGDLRRNILEASAAVAAEKGFDIVLSRESVVIAEKDLDITAEVLKALDTKLPAIALNVE